MPLLSDEVVTAARNSVLSWLATVDSDGQPNVSPKEIFAIIDHDHLVVANIASPTSVRNVRLCEKVCISFIDVWVQKGFKVIGTGENIGSQEPGFSRWAEPLLKMAGPRFPIHSVIVIRASAVQPIVAPSYRLYPGETTEESQVASALRTYGVSRVAGGSSINRFLPALVGLPLSIGISAWSKERPVRTGTRPDRLGRASPALLSSLQAC